MVIFLLYDYAPSTANLKNASKVACNCSDPAFCSASTLLFAIFLYFACIRAYAYVFKISGEDWVDTRKEETVSNSRCSPRCSDHLTREFSYLGSPQEIDSREWCSFLVIQWLVKVSVRPHKGRMKEGKLQIVADVMICEMLQGLVVANS